jgi:hypothetical protein
MLRALACCLTSIRSRQGSSLDAISRLVLLWLTPFSALRHAAALARWPVDGLIQCRQGLTGTVYPSRDAIPLHMQAVFCFTRTLDRPDTFLSRILIRLVLHCSLACLPILRDNGGLSSSAMLVSGRPQRACKKATLSIGTTSSQIRRCLLGSRTNTSELRTRSLVCYSGLV